MCPGNLFCGLDIFPLNYFSKFIVESYQLFVVVLLFLIVIFHEVFQHSVAQLELSPYKACRNHKPALPVQHDLFCKGTDCVCPYFTACLAHVRFWFFNCLKSTQEFHAFLKVISSIKELSVSEHAPYI